MKEIWLTRQQAADLCGLSTRQFDEAIRPRAIKAEKGTGKKLLLNAKAIVAALVAYRVEQAKPAIDPTSDDPLLAAVVGESPALERYRLAKARLAEHDLSERDGILLRADAIKEALMAGIRVMRATGDRLVRQLGNVAGEIFNEGVAEFEAAAIRVLQTFDAKRSDLNPPGSGGNPNPATPNDR